MIIGNRYSGFGQIPCVWVLGPYAAEVEGAVELLRRTPKLARSPAFPNLRKGPDRCHSRVDPLKGGLCNTYM